MHLKIPLSHRFCVTHWLANTDTHRGPHISAGCADATDTEDGHIKVGTYAKVVQKYYIDLFLLLM